MAEITSMSRGQKNYLQKLRRDSQIVRLIRILIFLVFLALWEGSARLGLIDSFISVSYTHLDVDKRQVLYELSRIFHSQDHRTGSIAFRRGGLPLFDLETCDIQFTAFFDGLQDFQKAGILCLFPILLGTLILLFCERVLHHFQISL